MVEREDRPGINQRYIAISQVTLGSPVDGQIQEFDLVAHELLEDEEQSVLQYAALDSRSRTHLLGIFLIMRNWRESSLERTR